MATEECRVVPAATIQAAREALAATLAMVVMVALGRPILDGWVAPDLTGLAAAAVVDAAAVQMAPARILMAEP